MSHGDNRMIQGLKVTLTGDKLAVLCTKRAEYHQGRERVYAEQVENMRKAHVEGMNYTGGDPKAALQAKAQEHANEASAMAFIAENLDRSESYLLDNQDLHRLGIVQRGW